MKTISIKRLISFLIALIYLIKDVFTQDFSDLFISQPQSGIIKEKDTYVYYRHIIDQNFVKGTQALQIVVEPPGDEMEFSDPDIYISSTEKFPTTKKFDWYADQFGMDLITIEPEEIVKSDAKELYIGVTCEKGNCPFKIKIQYENEVEVEPGYQINMRLNKDQDTIFKLKFKKNNNNQIINMLQINLWSPNFAEYSVFVSKDRGTTTGQENVIKMQPAWIGSSTVLIKGENLCDECDYNILVYPKSNDGFYILTTDIGTDFFKFKYGAMAFGESPSFQSTCYRKQLKPGFTKIIVSAMLFSGTGKVFIHQTDKVLNDLTESKYQIELKDEFVLPLTKSDLDKNIDFLMICFQSYFYSSSFTIDVYDIKEAEYQQLNNILFNGIKTPGYLSQNTITKYTLVDTEINTEIKIFFEFTEGKGNVYAYFCYDDCIVDKSWLEYYKDKIYKSENNIYTNSTNSDLNKPVDGDRNSINPLENYVIMPKSDNTCELTFKNSYNCYPIIIVDCLNESDCIFNLRVSYNKPIFTLSNSISHHTTSNYNTPNYYYINIKEDVSKLTIIMNSRIGKADLFLKRKIKPTLTDFEWTSQQEIFTPDVISLTKGKDLKSLIGEYYILVYTEAFTSYSIMYYTSTDYDMNSHVKNTTLNTKHLGIDLDSGMPTLGFLNNQESLRVFELHKKNVNEDPIKIFLTSLKVELEMFVFTTIDFIQKYIDTVNSSSPENAKEYLIRNNKFRSNEYNEIIVNSTDIDYLKNGTYYIAVARKFDDLKNNLNTTFYITATHSNTPIVLQENNPQIQTLSNRFGFSKQEFIFELSNNSKNYTLNLEVYTGDLKLLIFSENNKYSTKCSEFCKTLITYDNYCKKEVNDTNSSLCLVTVIIKQRDFEIDSKFMISVRLGDSSLPINLNSYSQYKTYSSIMENDYQFYTYYINTYDKLNVTAIYFNWEEGVIDVLARLVTWNSTNTEFPLYYNETDLYEVKYSLNGGRALSINDIKNDCHFSCSLLISAKGIYSNYEDKNIEYNIEFGGQITLINTDIAITGTFTDIYFFKFIIDDKIENFSISLTNANEEAVVYLNKGSEIPLQNGQWMIGNWRPDLLEINNDEDFFKNGNYFNGTYTGAIYSKKPSSFKLYINTHSKRVEEVYEFSESKCVKTKAMLENDTTKYCYFAYFYSQRFINKMEDQQTDNNNNGEKNYEDFIVISHVDYKYGDAIIYSNMINQDIDSYDNYLPSEILYDFSSKEQNSRIFLKTIINKNDKRLKVKTKENGESQAIPMVLFAVKCLKECDLSFKVREVTSNMSYLNKYGENIFYSPANSQSYMQYYFSRYIVYLKNSNDIRPNENGNNDNITEQKMQFSLLEGSGNVILKGYKDMNEFYDNKNYDKTGEIIETFVLNSNIDSHLVKIDKQWSEKYILAIIKTDSEDVGLSVTIEDLIRWEKLKLNVPLDSFSRGNYSYYYFKMHDKYQNVSINVNTEYKNCSMRVDINYYVTDKWNKNSKDIIDELDNYNFNEKNSDYYAVSYGQNLFLSISNYTSYKNIDLKDLADKKVYALLKVSFNYTSSENQQLLDQNEPFFRIKVNNYEKLDQNEQKVWLVEVEEDERFSEYLEKGQIKVLHMKKTDKYNDYLILSIDRCNNAFLNFKIYDQILYSNKSDSEEVKYSIDIKDSRYLIKLDAPKNDYFIVISQDVEKIKELENDNENLSYSNLYSSFIIRHKYYLKSLIKNEISISNTNPILTYELLEENKILLHYNLPKKSLKTDIFYKIYVLDNKDLFDSMNNICFLNSIMEYNSFTTNFSTEYMLTATTNEKSVYLTLTAILNGDTFVYNPIEVKLNSYRSKGAFYMIISKLIFYFSLRNHCCISIISCCLYIL